MSKSTTRGRQRGRRRNRPLRCEASTRMREWMCYRNHLVRRRGSTHGTSGRCPFHITKFSPGRSCWARESYSCPEYLMENQLQSFICLSYLLEKMYYHIKIILMIHWLFMMLLFCTTNTWFHKVINYFISCKLKQDTSHHLILFW